MTELSGVGDKAKARPRKRRTKRYPGSIAKRGDAWRIRLCIAGEYHRFTEKGTRIEAENFAITKHKELTDDHRRVKAGKPGHTRFSEVLRDFETYHLRSMAPGGARSYRNSIRAFTLFFIDEKRDPMVREITRGLVQGFLEWRHITRIGADVDDQRDVSNHTVARDRRVLNKLFNYACSKEFIDINPCQFVKAAKGDPRTPPILNGDELERLMAAAGDDDMLRMYILTLAETGVRSDSEALQLQWHSDVDFATGFLTVRSGLGRRTKSGKTRGVPMTPRLRAALQAHAAQFRMAMYNGQRSPYVFHHTHSSRTAVAGRPIRSIRRRFEKAIKVAKLPKGFRRHDLRHRRVTTWLADGKSAVLVMEAMGHADLANTMEYKHLVPVHLRSLVEDAPTAPPATQAKPTGA